MSLVSLSERFKHSKKLKIIILIILAVIVLFFMAREIYYYIVYERTDNAYVEGTIVPISPQVSGKVVKVYVEHNQRIKKGEPLVEIEKDDYLAELDTKKFNVNTLISQRQEIASSLNEAIARLNVAESNLESARAQKVLAQQEYERIKSLYQEDLVSKSKYDQAEATLKIALAHEKSAESQIREIKSTINTLTAKLKTQENLIKKAQQELKIAEINFKRTLILAPRDGRIAKKSVEVGQYVRPGQPLMAIVDEHDIWIGANFKETQIEKMRVGQPVKIKVDAYPGKIFKGHVASFQPGTGAVFSLFPPENATGNFVKVVQRIPVRIIIDSPFDPEYPLWPGMSVIPYVDVTVNTGAKLKDVMEKK
ncbi:MAG: HlyD family secretion protein [Thermodesulfovibrio sp.]|jgi:membrane fusion protein (multidrug efflux system)|uniref:HlyD family secretion protein n=1 Tax=unclassified Thermodesulfovibrio TaxID=2645936 RepID=UPI000856B2E1|nr:MULTISPECIES: HlyD family secretion protein [unclassified Thermodesulfovibrio]MDI1472196.1 HlyD family secretion protein [Thermodesulfovibrio sp. 1176]MDI6714059.1 HlyD family secretion protein [Thermodesulfovibrio sp.]ODA43866.1 Membrane fusion component of tripartite multidrug resistance system [Thermodesulfovibrio sp. N1]